MSEETIPFNKPYMTGNELKYIEEAHRNACLAGDGPFTKKCHNWLEKHIKSQRALLTHSCTAALEMAALLLDIQPGDEIIMPSYTFTSTANAFVLRGGVPVFVDIRTDTLNIDETLIESAITDKTKAIVPVHYAGVPCEMDVIMDIAQKYNIAVIEDAAQAILSKYKGQPAGSIGDMGTFSFHETKSIISGEGGALLINNPRLIARAEVIREKGTDRTQFFRGEVDKYTWQEPGSSFLPGELTAAFLWAQLEKSEEITKHRLSVWNYYHKGLEDNKNIKRPTIPENCSHNAHMYYIVLDQNTDRTQTINSLKKNDIHTVFHYIPLHQSPAGKKYCQISGHLTNTEKLSKDVEG
mgnify:CR=1 FL=1